MFLLIYFCQLLFVNYIVPLDLAESDYMAFFFFLIYHGNFIRAKDLISKVWRAKEVVKTTKVSRS